MWGQIASLQPQCDNRYGVHCAVLFLNDDDRGTKMCTSGLRRELCELVSSCFLSLEPLKLMQKQCSDNFVFFLFNVKGRDDGFHWFKSHASPKVQYLSRHFARHRLRSLYITLTIQVFKHHSVEPVKVAEVNHQNNEHSRTDFSNCNGSVAVIQHFTTNRPILQQYESKGTNARIRKSRQFGEV